jgi:hypothetical protein
MGCQRWSTALVPGTVWNYACQLPWRVAWRLASIWLSITSEDSLNRPGSGHERTQSIGLHKACHVIMLFKQMSQRCSLKDVISGWPCLNVAWASISLMFIDNNRQWTGVENRNGQRNKLKLTDGSRRCASLRYWERREVRPFGRISVLLPTYAALYIRDP